MVSGISAVMAEVCAVLALAEGKGCMGPESTGMMVMDEIPSRAQRPTTRYWRSLAGSVPRSRSVCLSCLSVNLCHGRSLFVPQDSSNFISYNNVECQLSTHPRDYQVSSSETLNRVDACAQRWG
jgi:hypothetical protein